mmetsp:Transcript_14573/g.29518  ORF Transcript_14573/g.29518 Transcript_14573/m.29518 type:complete len:230 (+) Transcript_14573:68-757(+)
MKVAENFGTCSTKQRPASNSKTMSHVKPNSRLVAELSLCMELAAASCLISVYVAFRHTCTKNTPEVLSATSIMAKDSASNVKPAVPSVAFTSLKYAKLTIAECNMFTATTMDNLVDIKPKITLGKKTRYVPTRNMLSVLVAQKKVMIRPMAAYHMSTVVIRKLCGNRQQRRPNAKKRRWQMSCPGVIHRVLPFIWFQIAGMLNTHCSLPLMLIHLRALTHTRCRIFRKA